MNEEVFYSQGLSFSCTRCSRCCRYEPGYVFLSYQDLERLSSFLQMAPGDFIQSYCRDVDLGIARRLSLTEKDNYDCIFWEEQGCRVYPARPLQCTSYPFWEPYLESAETWMRLAEECPGVGKGQIHGADEIRNWLEKRREERFIDLTRDDLSWMGKNED